MHPVNHGVIASASPRAPGAVHDPFDDGRALLDGLTSVGPALALRARIVEQGEHGSVATCSVRQGTVECAAAEVITVRVEGRA